MLPQQQKKNSNINNSNTESATPPPTATPTTTTTSTPSPSPPVIKLDILDTIKKFIQKKKTIPGRLGSGLSHSASAGGGGGANEPSSIPSTTHASHLQAAQNAGVLPSKQMKSPLEIGHLKLQRILLSQANKDHHHHPNIGAAASALSSV